MAELYIKGEKIHLKDGEAIAITFQNNDIAELKDRQASYSNSVKAPKTIENCQKLESTNDFHSSSSLPYQKNEVRVMSGGVNVVQDGVCFIDSVSSDFTINIYSALVAVFDLLGDKKLSDIDFDDVVIAWNASAVSDGWGRPGGITGYPYTFGALDDGALYSDSSRDVDVRTCVPLIFASEVFKRIFKDIGYDVASEVFTWDKYINTVISYNNSGLPKTKDDIDNQGVDSFRAVLDTTYFDLTLVSGFPDAVIYGDVTTDGWDASSGAYNTGTGNYDSPRTGTGNVYFRGVVQVLPDATYGMVWRDIALTVGLSVNGVIVQSKTLFHDDNNNDLEYYAGKWLFTYDVLFTAQISSSDDVKVVFQGGNNQWNPYPNTYRILRTNPKTSDKSFFGLYWQIASFNGIWDIAANLPEISQKDFVKAIAQLYCLTPSIDTDEKLITWIPFNRVGKNEMLADDWTEYLAEKVEGIEVKFHPAEYAQKNLFKFKDDEAVTSGYGDGTLTVNDQALVPSKTILTLPFAPSLNVTMLKGLVIGQVALYNGSTDSRRSVQPRILVRKVFELTDIPTNGEIRLHEPSTPFEVFKDTLSTAYLHDPYDSNGHDLRWPAMIDQNYSGIRSVLNKYKKIRVKVILPADVVATLNIDKPKYFKQLGAHFYLNKIENWQENKIVTAELVKL